MRGVIFGLVLVLSGLFVHADDNVPLTLHGRQTLAPLEINISDTDWRWLGKKQEVTIATWDRENPPLDILLDSRTYEGISADYLKIIINSLGVRCHILRFPHRDAALQALASGDVDMVVDDPGTENRLLPELTSSAAYLANRPALIRKESADLTVQSDTAFTLAVPEGYLSDEQIKNLFPHAHIIRLRDYAATLSAVAYGETDAALGNLTSVSFLIDRNFDNDLVVDSIFPETGSGSRFILRRQDSALLNGVNAVINALPAQIHETIIDNWFLGPDFLWLHNPISLSPAETAWIKKHPVIDVLASPLNAPLSLQDEDGTFYGISRDVLHLISLRTGIKFRFRSENDIRDMMNDVEKNHVPMLASLTWSQERAGRFVLTRPYLFTSYVLIVANKQGAPDKPAPHMKIAIAAGNVISEELKKQYPGITILSVANAGIAMKMVEEGKADAAVHNQLGAEYFIDRYFPGQLRIATYLSERRAEISFAVSRQERELEGILNKSLADIPPRALAKIVNKWQGTPDIRLETWRNYSTRHYLALTLSGVIIAGMLAWAFTLSRAVRTRQKAQKALSKELAFREILLNGSPEPIYVLDETGKVINSNRAWRQFFSDADESALLLPLYDSRHPLSSVLPELLPLFATEENDAREVYRQRCIISNGWQKRTVVHWAARVFENNEKRRVLICGWQDITEQEALLHVISDEKARAEQASREKGHFLATMSHEIRTPVSAIIGLLELAESVRAEETPEGEAVRLAYDSARTLLALIGDVLDLAKIETGSLTLTPDWINPLQIARQTLSTFDGLAKQKGLTLNLDDRLKGNYEYWLDAQRLRQTIFNFFSNSVKFTHTGNVGIVLSDELTADGKAVLNIEVYDTGIGISEEDQPKLFRPYSQLEEGKLQTGTGLGLAISAELINLMGGMVTLQSQLSEGTHINISLPTARRRATAEPECLNTLPTSTTLNRSLNILIVDDHDTNRLILRRQLERLGCRVTEAADGQEALLFIEDESFDLIITDCQMPEMDGVTLTQTVRFSHPTLLIWGLTANAQPAERERCLAAGMNECLFKPLLPDDLKARLLEAFSGAPEQDLTQLIDFARLKDITGDSQTQLQALLKRAFENNRDDYSKLISAIQSHDNKVISSVAHRMVGSANVLGAVQLRSHLRRMETLISENAPDSDLKTAAEQIAYTLDIMDSAYAEFFRI